MILNPTQLNRIRQASKPFNRNLKNQLKAMDTPFSAWLDEADRGFYGTPLSFELAGICMNFIVRVAGPVNITEFRPLYVEDSVGAMQKAGLTMEDADLILDAFHLFVDFLGETNRWTGTANDFDDVHDLVTDEEIDEVPVWPTPEVPDLSTKQQLSGFAQMPLSNHALALLEWVGEGKEVTATGLLRLESISAAAATVGIVARGKTPRRAEQSEALPGFEDLEPVDQETITGVRSMKDVPRLHTLWKSLEDLELLKLRSGKATVSAEIGIGEEFSGQDRLTGYKQLTKSVLQMCKTNVCDQSILGIAAWEAARQLLLAACQPQTVPAVVLDTHNVEEVPAEMLAGLPVAMMCSEAMKELATYGIVEIGEYIQVPEHLISLIVEECVESLLDDESFSFELSLQEDGENYARLDVPVDSCTSGGTEVPSAPEAVYQLKIMLKDSKPPVWRRIMVSSYISLAELHEIISAAFDWNNSHLHLFEEPGRHGTKYSSVPVEPTPWEDSHEDEFETMLGEVMTAEGAKLDYLYDFGDDWMHRITLEKILDRDAVPTLPVCVTGRGMEPAEDSGGIWGWANMVEAVNDSNHPDHTSHSEWAGIPAGATLDPKSFDLEAVNHRISVRHSRNFY